LKNFLSPAYYGTAVLLLLLLPARLLAYYAVEGDDYLVDLRGSFSAGAGYALYPEDNFIYDDREEVLWNSDLRLLFETVVGNHFRAEANIIQNVRSTPFFVLPGSRTAQQEVERSSVFFWQQHDTDNTQASLALDSGNFSFGNESDELLVGRQPINLSVTFYFTPNDFFAPFAPQNFYREYKPGVDAIRYERRLADLTQLTVIGVLGYDEDPEPDSGWSRAPNWQRTTLLGRITHIAGDFELGFLGGTLPDYTILGASLQGDMLQWLGIRAECHYRDTWKNDLQDGLSLSVGFEHRFSGSLIARLEQMHNGTGYSSIGEADKAVIEGTLRSGYLGRDYTAVNISYEFTPLLNGEFLYLHNWTDYSHSFSFYGLYSLSDESELALNLSFPVAEEPDRHSLNSEFGVMPSRITLEYRLYF